MRKHFIYLATALAVAMTGLSACGNDDENDGPEIPDTPVTPDEPDKPNDDDPVEESTKGVFFLNQGNFYNHVPGGLYYLDYESHEMAANVFSTANGGQSLGDTPQCGVCYGDKIYIGVYESNCIYVLDSKDNKVVTRLSLTESEGQHPRSMVAADGKVYISMYNGYVSRLDTETLKIDATLAVGPNPENIGIYNGKIYVPNSNGMGYPDYGTTATVIDMKSFKVESTITVPLNPNKFMANEDGLYLLAMGNYGDVSSAVYKFNGTEFDKVSDASMMSVTDDTVYMINAPFGMPVEYKQYDCSKGTVGEWDVAPVDSPSALSVDPKNGRIFICSYILDGEYASYDAPGYVNVYSNKGKFIQKYNIGAGPASIFYLYSK